MRTLLAAGCITTWLFGSAARAEVAGPSTLLVVAHQDDDLLMLYPDLQDRLNPHTPVATVYLTNGNAGLACPAYTRGRELGIRAVHAALVGVADQWKDEERVVNGKLLRVSSLVGTQHTLWFVGLPNSPAPRTSLEYLWTERDAQLDSMDVDGRSRVDHYTAEQLTETLSALMHSLKVEDVRLLDASRRQPELYPFEHTDHVHSALFGLAALLRYGEAKRFNMYRSYNIQLEKKNLPRETIAKREALFRQYAQYDQKICETRKTEICGESTRCFPLGLFLPFMARRYTIENVSHTDAKLRTRLGRCLSANANDAEGARITTPRCKDEDAAQRWSLGPTGQLRQLASGRCVAAEQEKLGSKLVLVTCENEHRQRFFLNDHGQLRGPNASCVSAGLSGEPELEPCGLSLRQTGWRIDAH